MKITLIGRLTIVVLSLLLTLSAQAGGHIQKWPQKPDIKLDPALRSETTGTVLITGSNRGIGLRLATNYAERGWKVIATARKPKKADTLNELADKYPNVSVEYLDLLDHCQADKNMDYHLDELMRLGTCGGKKNHARSRQSHG